MTPKDGDPAKDKSLLDHFAGLAMPMIFESMDRPRFSCETVRELVAGESYSIAQAMLKERQRVLGGEDG